MPKTAEKLRADYDAVLGFITKNPKANHRFIALDLKISEPRVRNFFRFGLKSQDLPPIQDLINKRASAALIAPTVFGDLENAVIDVERRVQAIQNLAVDTRLMRQIENIASGALTLAGAENAVMLAEGSGAFRAAWRKCIDELNASDLPADKRAMALANLERVRVGLEASAKAAVDYDRRAHGAPDIVVAHTDYGTLPTPELKEKLERAVGILGRIQAGQVEIIDDQ